MYNYREVVCPYCGHKYIWLNTSEDGNSFYIYINKYTLEECLSSKCPACDKKSIISDASKIGIDINSEDFERITMRGL